MNKEEKKLCESVVEIFREIVTLCGTEDVENKAFDLEEEEYEKYIAERDKLIDTIVKIVKLREELFDFRELNTEVQDEEFWDSIERAVTKRVGGFMKVIPYRKLEKEKRLELIDKGFELIYCEREDRKFLIHAMGDEILADALLEILLGSEYVIATMYVSKRRFMAMVKNNICLQEEDLEYIWNKFEQNLSIVQAMAAVRANARVENRINYLLKRMDDLENLVMIKRIKSSV